MRPGASQLADVDFSAIRVLIVGDLMLDHFRYGSVRRISPEAPVPVIQIEHETLMLGGAGNVAANLSALGCDCAMIAVVGADRNGDVCRELLAKAGANPDLVLVDGSRRTTVKTRLISASQQLLRFDDEDLAPISAETEQTLIELFEREIAECQVIAISDYGKGVLTDRVLRYIIGRGKSLGVPVLVDPKRIDLSAYAGASVIKPNRNELSAASGSDCRDLAGCKQAAEAVIEMTGAHILLTMAESGMALFRKGQPTRHFPTAAAEVFDVSGAGDTVLATLCAGLAAGLDLEQAVQIANVAAGVVVRKLGTATLTADELVEAVDAQEPDEFQGAATRSQAKRMVERWKAHGLRVGFTNGCFDIVHAGHISTLRKARANCDRLIVGLNSDASIRRLKGNARPIQTEFSRAAVLAAIDVVDLVVIFDEDTPLNLIEFLMPSDLIKGADYSEDAVVGASQVKAAGGRVHLIDLVPGHSTTRAVERIRAGEMQATRGAQQ